VVAAAPTALHVATTERRSVFACGGGRRRTPDAAHTWSHGRIAQELSLDQFDRVALCRGAGETVASEELESAAFESNLTLGCFLYRGASPEDAPGPGHGTGREVHRSVGAKSTCDTGGIAL
jgi:hypothetical protein